MPIRIKTDLLSKEYNDRIAWMMGINQFGRRCRFLYPSRKIPCHNCHQGAGGLSLGRYKTGGPEPFVDSICPVCMGKGTFEETKTEEDILIVLFEPQSWFSLGNITKLPDNTAMIIGDRARSWNKVLQCSRVVLNTDVYNENTLYRLFGSPYPAGLFNSDDKSGSRFFYAYVVQESGG